MLKHYQVICCITQVFVFSMFQQLIQGCNKGNRVMSERISMFSFQSGERCFFPRFPEEHYQSAAPEAVMPVEGLHFLFAHRHNHSHHHLFFPFPFTDHHDHYRHQESNPTPTLLPSTP
jgi:hypothetical protein